MRNPTTALLAWAAVLAVGLPGLLLFSPQPVAGAPADVVDAATGEEVFVANCAECHGTDARGTGAAPALTGVLDRHTRGEIERTIREGRDVSPPMPAFEGRLGDDEIDSVIAYLATLPTGDDEDAAGPPWGRGMPHREGMWGRMMGDGRMGGWWGVWGILWVLITLAVLALLITGIVWLVRSMASGDRSRSSPSAGPGSTREVLDARYARGEIDREEYLQTRRDLGDPIE